MTEEEKKIETKIMPWRFSFLLVLSILLIVVFVYYLPMRFQYNSLIHQMSDNASLRIETGTNMSMEGTAHGLNAYHEENTIKEGLVVNLSATPTPITLATTTWLDFFVNERPLMTPVPLGSLDISQTKLMHVIGVRDDMEKFFHIHPQATSTPGHLLTGYIFSKPGRYKVWSEISKDSVDHTFGHPDFTIEGLGPQSEKQVSFARNIIIQDYQISLDFDEPAAKNVEEDLTFDVHTLTGNEIRLEDYLGVPMHLTIIKDDLRQFIHTHPEDDGHPMEPMGVMNMVPVALAHGEEEEAPSQGMSPDTIHEINFHVTFPESGLYKVFAQFRPKDSGLSPEESLTASFWIQVADEKPSIIPKKVTYVGISIVLMIALSLIVRRFLKVNTPGKL